MNGTIYQEIKKNNDTKKKEKIKFIVALLSTNFLVAIFCWSINKSSELKALPTPSLKILHPPFKMIVIPLTLLMEINPLAPEIPISIINKSKKILIQRAYLHQLLPTDNANGQNASRVKIEIKEEEILKLNADNQEEMFAIPELTIKNHDYKLSKKRDAPYEIYF